MASRFAGDAPPPILTVRDLTIGFPGDGEPIRPVDGVGFALAAGQTLGLVGESGCGKTLTALALLRLVPPPGRILQGAIELGGRDLLGLSEGEMRAVRGNRIAMIFQEPMTALNPVVPVGAQVAEAIGLHRKVGRRAAREGAVEALDRVGIADARLRAKAYPHQLSGGMRQRVMIAMALACRPDLLIADEATTALDTTIQAQILELLLDLQAELGTAILFISHNLGVVSEIADEVAVMYAGRIVERARTARLFHAPGHPYTRGLIGTLPRPAMRGKVLATIPGSVPDPRDPLPGCPFRPRCKDAIEACAETRPQLAEVPGAGAVACLEWEGAA